MYSLIEAFASIFSVVRVGRFGAILIALVSEALVPGTLVPGALAIAQQRSVSEGELSVPTVGSAMGLRSFAPGRWGVVRVMVNNPSDQPAMIRALVNLKDSPNLRFGRDVWVPAGSSRMTSIPLHVGKELAGADHVEIVGRIAQGDGTLRQVGSSQLGVMATEDATAFIEDSTFEEVIEDPRIKDPAYEVALALRASRGFRRTLLTPSERLLPTTTQGWDSVRHVIVAGDRLVTETAAASALRQWVAEGGRMWIQLNRCDPEILPALFGSTMGITLIDQVPLTTFGVIDGELQEGPPVVSLDVEEPVELIRSRVEGGKVLYQVDGWPAAVEFTYGRGVVLVTLLDAHGWMRPRDQSDPPYRDPLVYTDFMPLETLDDLANRMYQPRPQSVMDREVISGYVSDRIGYRIPSRSVVLAVLAGFCLAILLGGVLLASRQRLEYLSLLAAAAGLVAAVVLVGIGLTRRGEVPPTLAELRVVSVSPQTGDVSSQGSVAIYQTDSAQADFGGEGLRIDPQMPALEGQIREWIWSDRDRWRWEETDLPPGVSVLQGDATQVLRGSVAANAELGPQGIAGRVEIAGLLPEDVQRSGVKLGDGMVLFPFAPPMAANLKPDGSFEFSEGDRLAEGQYTNTTLLDDEQRRRAAVLGPWLAAERDSLNASGPVLVAWVEHSSPVLSSDRQMERLGTALVTVPLRFSRPAPGTEVRIPSGMMRIRSVVGERGQSTAFDNQRESWAGPNARSTVVRLRFQLPPTILPIELTSLKLVLDCHLPSRPLGLFVVREKERNLIANFSNPSGLVEAAVSDAAWLKADAKGGVVFDIDIGDLTREVDEVSISNSGWRIRSSRLEATGKTLPVREEGSR